MVTFKHLFCSPDR